jgi:hypothetical protein
VNTIQIADCVTSAAVGLSGDRQIGTATRLSGLVVVTVS